MDKGHVKAVRREEIKTANTYMEKFTQGEMQTKQCDTIWTCHNNKGCEEEALSLSLLGV